MKNEILKISPDGMSFKGRFQKKTKKMDVFKELGIKKCY